jgi:hypothetical protein
LEYAQRRVARDALEAVAAVVFGLAALGSASPLHHARVDRKHRTPHPLFCFDWFGIGKAAVSEGKRGVEQYLQHRHELRWDFVKEALGPEPLSCLELPAHTDNGVSFTTIERRLDWLQEKDAQRAAKCGIPAINDRHREQWIRTVLQEMVMAGLLRRCRI